MTESVMDGSLSIDCFHGRRYDSSMQYDDLSTKLSVASFIANGNGRSVSEIASHFGISVRTAYRVLDRLQSEGYPLTNDVLMRGKEKLWTMLHHDEDEYGNPLPSSDFTPEDEIFLHYILTEARNLESVVPAFSGTRTKLVNLLGRKGVAYPSIDYPSYMRRKLFPIENIRSIGKGTEKKLKENISVILRAINDRRKCCMSYKVPNYGMTEPVISPVFCFFYDGGMYLQAIMDDGRLRTYAIERICSITIIAASTAVLPDFDPHLLLTDPFGPFIGSRRIDAEIWIAPRQVQYVKERIWPESVRIEDRDDGSAIFHAVTYSEHGLTDWILSQTSSAKILSPIWLRDKIAMELKAMCALYCRFDSDL